MTADVVVIGAGHNGLVAAGYLARAGIDVLVVEAAPAVGGMTSSAPVIAAAPQHRINLGAVDVIFMRASTIVADLELERHGFRTVDVDPAYAYLHPDGASLAFWRDPRRTIDEIRRFSPADARAYGEFVEALDALLAVALPMMRTSPVRPQARALADAGRGAVRNRRRLRGLVELATSSGQGVIEERFRHPVVVSALAALAGAAGPIDTEGSGLTHLLVGLLHRIGVGRAVGGMQALPDALAASLIAAGGRVRTSAPVEQIVMRDGRAAGVRLASGEEVLARHAVLGACDPKTTLDRLLPPGTLPSGLETRVAHIPTCSSGATVMKVDLALSGRLELRNHRRDDVDLRVPVALVGTYDEISGAYRDAAAGALARDLFFWGVIPTAADPSQAPQGQDTLYLYVPAVPLRPHEPWAALADGATKALLTKAGDYYAGIEHLEIGRFVETPDDMAARLRVTDNCIVHVDFALLRSGPLRPALGFGGYATPVPGLFLTGAGTHPGGGVSGIPGQLAAARVARSCRSGR